MTISYNWLSEYLPTTPDPNQLSTILTAVGLEVESMERYEEFKLEGLVIGEVLEVRKHLAADKLTVTRVNIGPGEPLQIVCGAPNVAAGQKVIVAPAGATIHPIKGEPVTMRVASIRGEKSEGMICAEDEIGLGNDHSGIMVLETSLPNGTPATSYFAPYTDWIFEIGLTPNRMDAMSHIGVARDICAYLSHHEKGNYSPRLPFHDLSTTDTPQAPISVEIQNAVACRRYSGLSIQGITVAESPKWLQQKLKAIGQRPINNIVDITNLILHETGQPLHAFDADKIAGNRIIVRNLPEGTPFTTLDGKTRKLSSEDLMICNGINEGMCIAGVFGGINSGVSPATTNIFLESAWFNPVDIRKTSFRHGLHTDAATRFEKNVDISATVTVLQRAALLIQQIAGGAISPLVDVYPVPATRQSISITFEYLAKLSGKRYETDAVKRILVSLGFEITLETAHEITVSAPLSKPDITLPADIVEEVLRIDGLDNVPIPSRITITPSIEAFGYRHTWKEKIAAYLVGLGFREIFTNSITNAAYFGEDDLRHAVRLLNNLSAEHNVMRPSMLETGLEAISYNLNRKNHDLKFFEFGKTYATPGSGRYEETNHLCLYVTGSAQQVSWKQKQAPVDIFFLKGAVSRLLELCAVENEWTATKDAKNTQALEAVAGSQKLVELRSVADRDLKRFDIKQPVFYADINWEALVEMAAKNNLVATELPRQLPVYRDLALIVPRSLPYEAVEKTVKKVHLDKLRNIQLFDIFESEKVGAGKKSLALSFTFLDEEKTLTDAEIDKMMRQIMKALEENAGAEIRK